METSPDRWKTPGWKAPGAILLISCYELGHQPIGLASPLAFLRRAGFAPAAMDLAVEPFSAEKAAGALFAGISVPMHTALRLGVAAARKVREANPGCHICFYGLYANLNAEYLLENEADSVIAGEFEAPLTGLIGALARSGEPSEIPGVGVSGRPAEPHLEKIPLTLPHREDLPPLASYAHLLKGGARLPVGTVEASRGCKHLCLHCPIPPVYGGRFFTVPRELVMEDIRALVSRGAQHITFADPDFLNGPAHAMRIVRALHSEFPTLTFDFTAKIEHLGRHLDRLGEFRDLGCAFIVTAAESLSETVLENLGKGHTREEIFRVVRAARKAGISIRPSFVSFTPWTTAEDYFDLLDFALDFGLIDEIDPIQFAIRLLIPPGADLLGKPATQPFIGDLDAENFIYRWAHPDPRMDRLHEATLAAAEEAEAKDEDPALTYWRIRRLAAEILELPDRLGEAPDLPPDRLRPPRLTESWFC